MNPQLNYYLKNDIIAVSIEDGKSVIHHAHRKNLYEKHLKIPQSWFHKKSLLEFGPNAGNNALCFAQWGSKLELVGPVIK